MSSLHSPHSIACNDEDNIYCGDMDGNKILTCDGNGENIQIHEVELKRAIGRLALAITDQKLFIAENGLSRFIKVYNKQLQHLSNIKHINRNMDVMNISVDIHQNLYLSDWNNSCVHVFTKHGVHLRSIGQDKEELKQPWGLCLPLIVNMSPHMVRKVRMRETLTVLVIFVLTIMVSFMLQILHTVFLMCYFIQVTIFIYIICTLSILIAPWWNLIFWKWKFK